MEGAPVCEHVAEHLNANLFETRVAGHGRHHPDALLNATAEARARDTQEAVNLAHQLGERVIAGDVLSPETTDWVVDANDRFVEGLENAPLAKP